MKLFLAQILLYYTTTWVYSFIKIYTNVFKWREIVLIKRVWLKAWLFFFACLFVCMYMSFRTLMVKVLVIGLKKKYIILCWRHIVTASLYFTFIYNKVKWLTIYIIFICQTYRLASQMNNIQPKGSDIKYKTITRPPVSCLSSVVGTIRVFL
jgi:hypothetical protein